MVERENLSRLSLLALRKRREGLTHVLPPLGEVLRGSLMERYLTCGNPDCKCARGERHGPVWYLSVTLDQSHRAGCTVPADQVVLPIIRKRSFLNISRRSLERLLELEAKVVEISFR